MAWNPFGVLLEISATAGAVTRISATQFTVKITASWETYYSGAQTNYGMTASSGGSSVTLNPFGTKSSGKSATLTGTYSISGNAAATKTVAVTFRNFNNDNGDSATKAINLSVNVPAWTSYTVKYNANGGSGAPSSQTKGKDQALTLSSTKPTRANYTFKGWSASASSTTATYAAGGSYTANAGITFYAVWELAYVSPIVHSLTAARCNSSGTEVDDGTCGLIKFDWETTNTVSAITIAWESASAGSGSATVTASGTSGAVSKVIAINQLSVDASYTITVTVKDSGGESFAKTTLNGAIFPIDAKAGGKGVSFGKPAELGASESLGGNGVADFAFDAKFNQPVYGKALGMDRLPAIPINSDLNDYMEPGCYAVHSNAIAASCANIPVDRAGRLEVWSATGEGVRLEQWSYLRQRFIPYNSGNAVWERELTRGEDNVWNYYEWWKSSLTPEASEKVYSKAAATIALSANTVLGAVNTYTKIPFDKVVLSTNSRLTLSSNAIRIGSNIQHVKVNGQTLVSPGSTNGLRHIRIQKVSGGTTSSVAWVTVYVTASQHEMFPLTPVIVSVKEGDLIQVVFYTGNASDSISSGSTANGWQTYLTVEEL